VVRVVRGSIPLLPATNGKKSEAYANRRLSSGASLSDTISDAIPRLPRSLT